MTMGELIHYRLIITGRVQQVWFRKFCKENADLLKLGGSVKNLEDGSVELFVAGPLNLVETLIKKCRKGPKLAHVEKVKIDTLDYKEYDNFDIL